jgi:hypothetical protein
VINRYVSRRTNQTQPETSPGEAREAASMPQSVVDACSIDDRLHRQRL